MIEEYRQNLIKVDMQAVIAAKKIIPKELTYLEKMIDPEQIKQIYNAYINSTILLKKIQEMHDFNNMLHFKQKDLEKAAMLINGVPLKLLSAFTTILN